MDDMVRPGFGWGVFTVYARIAERRGCTRAKGGRFMATFVVLLNFTDQAMRTMGDTSGLDAAKQGVQAMGGQWKAWYLTMGQYDAVVIVEAPDDETAARIALAQAASGGVRTQTLRAFTEDEYRQLAASLPGTPS